MSVQGEGSIPLPTRLERIEKNLSEVLETVQALDGRDKADLVRYEHLAARVSALESWRTWLERIVGGVVILAVLAGAIITR
ncbi:hypothetical protein EXU48_15730 [Occultella glacieicola]|uniref:Hemolysin XhlA n=1 Tax=Occultella glacieicola TaxID=2518684 RepID=A0ABY2E317_9MICO|nr:hypothetical protein [Occultella glacieicola]TDE91594.1 hypothetical protein EXU48_15730 [Occultella glacieicola]